MTGSCRFVHASDLHLEGVASGLGELPDALWGSVAEAGYRAAQRVFEAVLEEEADFLLLVGDVLDAQQTGPRGPLFFVEQCLRLAERSVPVYWLLAGVDRLEDWPAGLKLPENVHRILPTDEEPLVVERRGSPLARLQNVGPLGGNSALASELRALPTIVAHYGLWPTRSEWPGAQYVAWGGLHTRQTLSEGAPLAHSCGTPQGRSFDETGAHGVTLVELASGAKPQLAFIPTDAVRWQRERVVLEDNHTRADFERLVRQRAAALASGAHRPVMLVDWTLSVSPTARHWSRWRRQLPELLEWLRGQLNQGASPVWSTALALEPPAEWHGSLYQQETMLAEFLRELSAGGQSTAAGHALWDPSGERPPGEIPEWLMELSSPAARQRIFRRAAALGVELLSGEERER